MGKTAEEAMLFAAMEDDQETLDRLARDTTGVERRHLTKALNQVYDALVVAAKADVEIRRQP